MRLSYFLFGITGQIGFVPPPTLLRRTHLTLIHKHTSLRKSARGNFHRSVLPVAERASTMPRGVKKENLPTKVCVTCGRSFTWRKKWERVWDEVTTCSKSCNKKRRIASRIIPKMRPAMELEHVEGEVNRPFGGEPKSTFGLLDFASASKGFQLLDSTESCTSTTEQEHTELSHGDNDQEYNAFTRMTIGDKSHHTPSSIGDADDFSGSTFADDASMRIKADRKQAKKAKKAARRAEREGRGDPKAGQKTCDQRGRSVDLLIRCRTDATLQWKLVCGKCWKDVSGGVVDGDSDHPYYTYGGLWKNRRAQKAK